MHDSCRIGREKQKKALQKHTIKKGTHHQGYVRQVPYVVASQLF